MKNVVHQLSEMPGFFERIRAIVKPMVPDEVIKEAVSRAVVGPPHLTLLMKHQDEFCIRCGTCCRKTHKGVIMTKTELKVIAKFKGVNYKKLKKQLKARLTDKPRHYMVRGPCTFLKGKNECTIYDVRPMVCAAYPAGILIQDAGHNKPLKLNTECEAVMKMLEMVAISETFLIMAKRKGIELPVIPQHEMDRVGAMSRREQLDYFWSLQNRR